MTNSIEAKDILLADLNCIRDIIARNEAIGEKRFSSFITLVTAVGAGLVALATNDLLGATADRPLQDWAQWVVQGALLVLIIFSLLTYARMLYRDKVSKHLYEADKATRRMARELCPALNDKKYEVSFTPGKGRIERYLVAGYSQTAAAVVGLLVAVFVAIVILLNTAAGLGSALVPSVMAGGLSGALLWRFATARKPT